MTAQLSTGLCVEQPGDSRETPCACGRPARPGQRTCNGCHAAYMRGWRNGRKLANPDLIRMAETLVLVSSQLRDVCPHPPGRACRCRDRARRGEQLAARLSRMILRA